MELKGERRLDVDRAVAWAALNDIELLRACIPGCESITPTAGDAYELSLSVAIGPVKARFKGRMTLSDIVAPESYTIHFDGQGGAAGFARGDARVSLQRSDGNATLTSADSGADAWTGCDGCSAERREWRSRCVWRVCDGWRWCSLS